MSGSLDSAARLDDAAPELPAGAASVRRPDVDAKHHRVAALLEEVECKGLLILEPENIAWLTSGGTLRGDLDPGAWPALFYSADERWLIASNVESPRLFDEEIDALGYQLKEWPWHWGREELLTDLCQGRVVACDRPWGRCLPVGEYLGRLRRTLTLYDQACYRSLGKILSHALEATCRSLQVNDSEREIAGQLSHRLLHRGAHPVSISVAADGRLRRYRQCGFTTVPVTRTCVVTGTARKYGLCATASRTVALGAPEPTFRQEYDAACRISATYVASTWPDSGPREILNAGRRVYAITGYEHDWLLCPQGHLTGWLPVELPLTFDTTELFQPGWVVTWNASAGSAASCDTFLITNSGPKQITASDDWPQRRVRVQGANLTRPDLLVRE
jgi:Xaa-Pro aminopeptidase